MADLGVFMDSFTRNNVGNPEQERGQYLLRMTHRPRSGELCRKPTTYHGVSTELGSSGLQNSS